MKTRFLSLIENPPDGFVTGTFGKRELLSGVVVVLAADCASAYALLPDFRARVEGLVITFDSPGFVRAGPLLWHLALPRETLPQNEVLLALALEMIVIASQARNDATVAQLDQVRLRTAHEIHIKDYLRATGALREQVGLLAASENKLGTILDSAEDCIYLKDTDGKYLFANRAVRELWNIKNSAEIVGFDDEKFFDRATTTAIRGNDQRVLASGETLRAEEINTVTTTGKTIVFRTMKLPLRREDGSIYALCGISTDITERKQSEEKLHLAASVFSYANEGIMITAANGTIIDINDSFSRITGYSRDEILGRRPSLFKSGVQDALFYATLWRTLLEQGHWSGEIWNRRKNGEVYAEMLTISGVHDSQGKIEHYVALYSDITALKEHEKQLDHLAHYDVLTTLPNRTLLADRLHQAMTQAQRREQRLAVAYLDLDGFKAINDNHGHEAGDQLLIALANRMKLSLRDGDTLARLGGDEFVAVLIDLDDVETSVPMLTRLLAAAAQPVVIGNDVHQVSASLGVTFYPQVDDVDADQLLRQADQAMYQAKLAGKNRYHVFDADLDRSVRGHHENLEEIRRALSARQFVLHYQPKVNMRTGAVIGVEALIRWQHPRRGLLLPEVFLPSVEDNLLAVELGEWVIETALTQIEAWHQLGLDIPISVNVSARQLLHGNFAHSLCRILTDHAEVRAGDLEIEVLETSALEDLARVSRIIEDCREVGVDFALDDFGTGYSSLTYLKRLSVSQLKIDQSFVHDMLEDPDDLAILGGILSLASSFRRQVIAEGVETVEHGSMLLQLGCELAQGFGIAPPMLAQEIPAWVLTWRPDPAWSRLCAVNRDDLPLLFAGVEHRAWIAAFEAFLKGKRISLPPDHHQCSFGAWLKTEGRLRHGKKPAFNSIKSLHSKLHQLADELLELWTAGQSPAAEARLGEIHCLWTDLHEQLNALAKDGSRKSTQ